MMKLRALIGSCAVMALGAGTACEEMPPAEVAVQPQVMPEAPAYAAGTAASLGQWVWTERYGWVWVPAEASPLEVQGEPYVYLYTPAYGWTWFDSPWGWYGPDGGWGWARPWYGSYWGPRYHAYASPGVQVAPPAHRAAPGVANVAPPAYRGQPRPFDVTPPAYRAAPRPFNVSPPAYRAAPRPFQPAQPAFHAPPRPFQAAPPAYHFAPSRPMSLPRLNVHPGGGFHGGRR